MACVSCAGGAGAANPMMQQMMNAATGGAEGGGGQDLMSKVMDILRKLGLDGARETNVLSKDDLTKLVQALKQMGTEGMKQVLSQNPELTKQLSQVL
jgi:hypothetical protein